MKFKKHPNWFKGELRKKGKKKLPPFYSEDMPARPVDYHGKGIMAQIEEASNIERYTGKVTEEDIEKVLKDLEMPKNISFELWVYCSTAKGVVRMTEITPVCHDPECSWCGAVRKEMEKYLY